VFTNVAYKNTLFSQLRAEPVNAILQLLQNIISDLWLVLGQAWGRVLIFPAPSVDGPLTTLLYVAVVIAVGIITLLYVINAGEQNDRSPVYWALAIGLIGMLLGGGPYWLATLEVSLSFPASRFTMSFMLGCSLFLAGMVEILPKRIRPVVAVLFVAFAAGRQVMFADAFRRDWEAQKNLFWQMNWRVPGIKPHTVVLMNEELSFYADNSISAPLNWIYSPNQDAHEIEFVLFYPTNRLNKSLSALQSGLPVHYEYIAGEFNGNTSDVLAFYYDPPACLRLLDPDLDSNNRFIRDESLMREASALSNPERILRETSAVMPQVYRPEPAHGWCYYFEKAELARQFGDWAEVARLGNEAFKLDDHPNNPVERFVFIEGYAHVGEWEHAVELSKLSYKVSKDYVGPLLCRLWKRIETETIPSDGRSETLDAIQTLLACKI
jgi:type IV secretory pathway VirB2 component (pilin)